MAGDGGRFRWAADRSSSFPRRWLGQSISSREGMCAGPAWYYGGEAMPLPPFIKPMAPVVFAGHMIKSFTDWKQPQGESGNQYSKCMQNDTKVPSPDTGIPIFTPHVMQDKHQLDTMAKIGQVWRDFMDASVDAIQFGLLQWKLQAK